jgi:HAD superfamily hydrolase (TIGR01459 family)
MPASNPPIAIIEHVRDLASRFDAWICDIWGVLHNGVAAHSSAVEACIAYRRGGGTIILVTNAPRPNTAVAEQLARLGISTDAYDLIITSGDVTRGMLEDLGQTSVFHIGPSRDLSVFEGLPLTRTVPNDASAIICTGLFDDTHEKPEDYRDTLAALSARNIPMICANPDLTVDRGGTLVPCAGAVAAVYATLGGRVEYAGKPYRPIYTRAFSAIAAMRAQAVAPSRVLGIGDGVKTDIMGADRAGIAALYIASAIHLDGPLTAASVAALYARERFRPIAAQVALRW